MTYLNDRVLDNGLVILDTEANRLHICSQEPTTYTEATSTYSLGNSATLSIGAPENRSPNGRRVVVASVGDGVVTSSGTANYWAIVDTVNSRFLATGLLDDPAVVTAGNGFSITPFDIGIPDTPNFYLRPDGNSLYLRPDGVSRYLRPQ